MDSLNLLREFWSDPESIFVPTLRLELPTRLVIRNQGLAAQGRRVIYAGKWKFHFPVFIPARREESCTSGPDVKARSLLATLVEMTLNGVITLIEMTLTRKKLHANHYHLAGEYLPVLTWQCYISASTTAHQALARLAR